MTCTHDCNQGRDCECQQACELPITMSDEFNFDWVMRLLWDAMRWVGLVLSLIATAFFIGYKS